ncbi:LysR family transcriptional regulator [Agrobacterium tumefaciens]|uniref:LysR family transcriptional regulator n=1 Tax=Agrobacterium tumefaciens complex TaxID=1183400 RepID=UPI00157422F4|nr:LysR family transcriptional regulator [Agrobacterium fabrum]NSZ09694.1 LysR family transcriptional regulator [Agrobacterium tumefaciens]
MIDTRSLEIFYWIAQLGSFRRAAMRLNTTQPAVSHRIANLEADLGVDLFIRGPRVATLTSKGRELMDYAERILHLMEETERAVASPDKISGVVRIGVAETIVHTWLTRFIEKAYIRYPSVTLEIEVDVSPNLRNSLVENALDIAFLLGPVSEPTMWNQDLSKYPLSFVARSSMSLEGETVKLEELVKTPIITYHKTTRPYLLLRKALTRPDLPAPRIYSNSSLSTIVRMTLDGIGISVIPPAVIRPELARKELTLIETDVDLPDLLFTVTMPSALRGSLPKLIADLAIETAQESENR